MIKKLACVPLLTLLFASLMLIPAIGQTSDARLDTQAEKMRSKVRNRGVGERIKVELVDKTRHEGVIREIGPTSFTVVDKIGDPHIVLYSQVKSVGGGSGSGLSTGAKIGIGVAIGAGVVLAVLAAIVASDN